MKKLLVIAASVAFASASFATMTQYTYTLGAFNGQPCFDIAYVGNPAWEATATFGGEDVAVVWQAPGAAFFVQVDGAPGTPLEITLQNCELGIGDQWTLDNLDNGFNNFNLGMPFDFCEWDGCGDITNVEVPAAFGLDQNYPNPFNPNTEISYQIAEPTHVNIAVFNVTGEKVATLIDGDMPVGYHSVNFNAANLSSGVYFYRMEAGSFSSVEKMTLIK